MAAAKKPAGRPAAKAKTPPKDVPRAICDAAARIAGDEGWGALTMARLADEAGIDAATLHVHAASRAGVLMLMSRMADAMVLAELADEGEAVEGEAVRDRLFDVLMTRYEALLPWRDALARLPREAVRQRDLPGAAPVMGCRINAAMATMLEAAGSPAKGLSGPLKIAGLKAIWLSVLRVWFSDDSDDLSRTMSALDKRLDQADEVMAMLSRRSRTPA